MAPKTRYRRPIKFTVVNLSVNKSVEDPPTVRGTSQNTSRRAVDGSPRRPGPGDRPEAFERGRGFRFPGSIVATRSAVGPRRPSLKGHLCVCVLGLAARGAAGVANSMVQGRLHDCRGTPQGSRQDTRGHPPHRLSGPPVICPAALRSHCRAPPLFIPTSIVRGSPRLACMRQHATGPRRRYNSSRASSTETRV